MESPSLTPLLSAVHLRLRVHKVVLIGDITSVSLSIQVDEKDRNALSFFDDMEVKNLLIFRWCRVIFRAGQSLFILSGILQHHIGMYAEIDPVFAEKIFKGFYVDDLVTGSQNFAEAFILYEKAMKEWKVEDFEWESGRATTASCLKE